MVHLPTTAVRAAPQGQLGLGAAYFAANNANANPAGLFLKQGFVRFNGLGGIAGQSLKVGRMEFNDGLEVTPRNSTLAALKRDRISQRLIGNFGFSDVLRSLDGVHYVSVSPLSMSRPSRRTDRRRLSGRRLVRIEHRPLYGALTRQVGSERSPGEWRLFGRAYRIIAMASQGGQSSRFDEDQRTGSIRVNTFGGHYLHVRPPRPVRLASFCGGRSKQALGERSTSGGRFAA